jgi:hypothetical protein
MKEYMTISFGEHHGKSINEIPMDYLIWLLPKIQNYKQHRLLYFSILEFFLTKEIKVERGKFYFEHYQFFNVGGEERPFIISLPLTNSKGENVYVVGSLDNPVFIEEKNNEYKIASGYSTMPHKFGITRMIVEHNPEYYFTDSLGNWYIKAYLMRAPHTPEEMGISFSENLLIKNIKK